MPVKRRSSPRLLVVALAVPVIAAVYLAVAGRRAWSIGRDLVVGLLGLTVIGSVYAEVAARTAVVPARRQPLPLTICLALALAVMGSGMPSAPVRAAASQSETVVQAVLAYKGAPYVWGAEGPNAFDCSGLVYRVFRDAGEAPLISGRRLTARGYYMWFASRGLTSRTDGRRGDLVVYGRGTHIGIYLGDGRVISALNERQGVVIHGLYALQSRFTTFLNVDWNSAQAADADSASDEVTTHSFINQVPTSKPDQGDNATDASADADADANAPTLDSEHGVIARGFAFGSVNVRANAGPDERILSWVTRGTTIDILAAGRSPGGALWYNVRKPSGKEGWVWSGWMNVVEGSVDN